METIFDHNVTEQEMMLICGYVRPRDKFPVKPRDQRWHNQKLYRLYCIRGDKQMQQKFLDMIPNDIHKFFTLTNHDFAK